MPYKGIKIHSLFFRQYSSLETEISGVFFGVHKKKYFYHSLFNSFLLMFQELTKKILCKKNKNKNFKRVFLETFFNLVDIKSRILFNRLTSNSVWAFSIYPSIVRTSSLAKLSLLLFKKKIKNFEKKGEKLTFFRQSPFKFFLFLFGTCYNDSLIDQENRFYLHFR